MSQLEIQLKREPVLVSLAELNYFHGRMGAGKTSVARLIDYCLGGSLELSPALQNEFVSARIRLHLENASLLLERQRGSDSVIAAWGDPEQQVVVPARSAAGVVLTDTAVETLSDLVFYLSGIVAPRVRTAKFGDDAQLRRLSLRDLMWYCYVDQDEIDSTFFHLDKQHDFRQYKSRDVLRFVLGFHTEHAAAIEADLDGLRVERQTLVSRLEGLRRALAEVGATSEEDLTLRIALLREQASAIDTALTGVRQEAAQLGGDAPTALAQARERARGLETRLTEIDDAADEIRDLVNRDRRHLHELEMLRLRVRRSSTARAVLQGVEFVSCPRCTQRLPWRPPAVCSVCGQDEAEAIADIDEAPLIERDAMARANELHEVTAKREAALQELVRARRDIAEDKKRADEELERLSASYDSYYLSHALTRERERAALMQKANMLEGMLRLPQLVGEQQSRLDAIVAREASLKSELQGIQQRAERDTQSLPRLKELFLDCLLRTSFPGVSAADTVEINLRDFLPRLRGSPESPATVTSFTNTSSGGKKTLFKACFAVALHRFATEADAPLPRFLMIDSPMKNISERENRLQFEAFYRMLYELKRGELVDTQLILIDKEYFPPDDLGISVYERHMRPNEGDEPNPYPPLIPYYQGH